MTFKRYRLSAGIFLALWPVAICAQEPSAALTISKEQTVYPDSAAGLQKQMDGLVQLIRSSDQKAFLSALDALAIPETHDWLGAHFPAYALDRMQKDYERAFAGYRSHVWWVMGNFAKDSGFGLKVESSETPKPLDAAGFEALLPRPDGAIQVENYRISPSTSKPPSWVSSFVYIDGRFRFVGGTYPFWNEQLTPLRGPMAIPVKSSGDLSIQGVPIDVDPKTPGIVAIVVLDVKIGGDGKARGFKVRSGEPQYVKPAEEYVRDWKFYPMASEFDLNVVFFRATH